MKKLIAVAILGLTAVSGWAQGTVDFRNGGITFPTVADRKVYFGAVGQGNGLTGVNWVAGLWYLAGPDRGQEITTAAQVGGRSFAFRPATTTVPGAWVAPAGVSPIFTFPNVAVGGTATLQVRVWDSSKFTTFEQALAAPGAEIGLSVPFNYTVPAAGSTPDKYYMDNLRAFAVVPEPSTIVLGLLGVASLLFLRRRK